MSNRIVSVIALVILAGAACSRQGEEPSPAGNPQSESPAPVAIVNVAAADMGGAVEELTENYGPGFTGRRLIDGLLDPTWKVAEHYNVDVPYPQEAVISFFERQPAVIGALTVVLPVRRGLDGAEGHRSLDLDGQCDRAILQRWRPRRSRRSPASRP